MALQLFEHNEKAYHAAVRMMDECGKAAIIHPTGTGKSYIAFKLIEEHPDEVVLWLSPSEYIFRTQMENLKKQDAEFPLGNVRFYTYAKLMCCTPEELKAIAEQKPIYIILDEFHRVGAECWGASTLELLKFCPDAKILGLSATNVRYLDNNRDMAEELFDGHVASEMTLGEAIVRDILPAPKYVTTVYKYQQELSRYQARVDNLRSTGIQDANQKYLDALRRALEQADGLDKVFAHHIENKSGKYIVFCAGKEHMDEMISHVPEWFSAINSEIHVYKAYSDDPGTNKEFAAFKTDKSDAFKLLFCIDMLNEGVHVEGISGVILFRPTVSPIVYKQQIGRALTAGDSATPLILDIVNNFEGLSSISGLKNEMKAAVHRLFANGESEKVVTERFEIIEQVRDCQQLFAQLQTSLASTWNHYLAEASRYYAEHGDLAVPVRYVTETGLSLGSWLQIQRLIRSGKRNGSLSESQIKRLDEIGMIWDSRADLAWKRGISKAEAYYKMHGDLLVPFKYVDENGFALGQWIGTKRKEYLSGALDDMQIQELESIGMQWSAVSAKWERGYAEASRYYEQNLNLDVPSKYITDSGLKLGLWISYQRQAYQGGSLTEEQIQRLEKIGMSWQERNDCRWMECYRAVEQYFQEYKNSKMPMNYKTENGFGLGRWFYAQKKLLQENSSKLSDERKKLLRQLLDDSNEKPIQKVVTMSSRKDQWQMRLDSVKEYQKEYGTLNIPAKYKTEDGFWLGRWWYLQKKLLKETPEKLKTERIRMLEELMAGEHKAILPESA